MPQPKRGASYTFTRALFSVGTPGSFQVNPTIAAGDFKISLDNGTLNNLSNLPVVAPAGSVLVKFTLTAVELATASLVDIVGIDVAGAEWTDFHESIDLTSQTIDDVPTAISNADALLTRDWTVVVSNAAISYTVWNALRFVRNAWGIVPGAPPALHVKQENNTSDAWVRNLTTDATATPITGTS